MPWAAKLGPDYPLVAHPELVSEWERQRPRFATVYLPGLDIILNRLPLDPPTQLASSERALEISAA